MLALMALSVVLIGFLSGLLDLEGSGALTPAALSAIAGALLSLVFSIARALSKRVDAWAGGLADNQKKLLMIAALTLAVVGIYALRCLGWFLPWLPEEITCSQAGIELLVVCWLLAVMANQSVYKLTPKKAQELPDPAKPLHEGEFLERYQ
jgi:hypothetical protein